MAAPPRRRSVRAPKAGPLDRLRRVCLGFPDAHEVEAWGAPTFRVRNRIFAMYAAPGDHHQYQRPAVWCMAAAGNQELMVRLRPDRFFRPPYVGPSGWVGIYLDRRAAWKEIAGLLRDAYELRTRKGRPG
jgi:hypothetical protein